MSLLRHTEAVAVVAPRLPPLTPASRPLLTPTAMGRNPAAAASHSSSSTSISYHSIPPGQTASLRSYHHLSARQPEPNLISSPGLRQPTANMSAMPASHGHSEACCNIPPVVSKDYSAKGTYKDIGGFKTCTPSRTLSFSACFCLASDLLV
jgi:hypothetical protein